jgi:uroporphyrinogen III methyltransferase/synthase
MIRVLITRPRNQAEAFGTALQAEGLEPVYFPVIEIRPIDDHTALDHALTNLKHYDWIVFTSVNGVDTFFERLEFFTKAQCDVKNMRVAAIGPRTAEALKSRGLNPDFVPDEYVAESILPGFGDLSAQRILLPQAEIASKALPEAIIKAGGMAHQLAVYQTLPVQPDPEGLSALRSGVNVVTLTSPSTVRNFVACVRKNGLDPFHLPCSPLFACIGPITEQAAKDEGLPNLIVSAEFTTQGLIEVIGKSVIY